MNNLLLRKGGYSELRVQELLEAALTKKKKTTNKKTHTQKQTLKTQRRIKPSGEMYFSPS